MRRVVLRATAAIVVLAALVSVGVYVYLRQSLPVVNGTLTVNGLTAPIDIVRDADAITHVFASNRLDAIYGLGYAHAQDRLWQMEFQRHIGHGRLSEIFGAITIPQDRFLRTVGFGRAAHSAWKHLSHDSKQAIDAYVAGVNEFISTHRGRALPPEFSLLRFEPEPWTGPDVLVWAKMMAWDLSKNYSFELLRHDIVAKLGPQKLAELLPPYPENGLSVLSARDMEWLKRSPSTPEATDRRPLSSNLPSFASSACSASPVCSAFSASSASSAIWAGAFTSALDAGLPAVRDFLTRGRVSALGSNNWVVDGTLSAAGKPLLANDPHLGAQMPSLWYLAHMSAGDFDVIGATLPGGPAVAIGRNTFIAWGETNVAADVEDLYRERIDASGKFAEFAGSREPLQIVAETIAVKGAQPIRLQVRISRHGPLISDAINANNSESKRSPKPPPLEPLAFRWTALDETDSTVPSFLRLNEARNWTEFTSALRDFIVPPQNFVYADVEGHIGYYAPGHIPIRARGDGALPAEGWSGDAEWTGRVPFDELPHTFDPPEHFIVTANHRPVPTAYPRAMSGEFTEPYRAQRILDLLRTRSKLTVDDFAAIQADTLSLHASALVPMLLPRAHPRDADDEQALSLLRRWNFDSRGDSSAAAIFQAWFLELTPTLVGDELGELLTTDYMGLDRSSFISRFVANTLSSNDSQWCDDVRTPRRETCDDAVSAALHAGVVDLRTRLGRDVSRWRWDAAHRAVFAHSGLDSVGALRPFLSRSAPHGGDWSTVNVGPVVANHPFDQHSIPGYRQIVDLSPANDSRFLDAVGQSGHPMSKHYDDFIADWQVVRHRRMRMNREDIERGAIGHLRLVPSSEPRAPSQR